MQKIGIEILNINQQSIKFALTGCDVSLANAIRRIFIAEVPTLAPHLVSIIENTSVLHDEFLCQRIGLIPFISDAVDSFKYPWECQCSEKGVEDCRICKTYFVLDVKNTNEEIMEVTSLHIKPLYPELKSEEDEVRPVKPVEYESILQNKESKQNYKVGVPIVRLAKDQQVKIKFEVQKGIGKMHAKWSPVSLATFQPDPEITLNKEVLNNVKPEHKVAIRDSCPTKVFEIHQNLLQVTNPEKCIYCGECKKTSEALDMILYKNLINIGKKKNRYIFNVQSVQTLSAISIVKKGMEVLRGKLEDIEKSIK